MSPRLTAELSLRYPPQTQNGCALSRIMRNAGSVSNGNAVSTCAGWAVVPDLGIVNARRKVDGNP